MKNYLLIVLVCIVSLFVSSYAKDNYKTIFVCDSLSNPICDAYIEIEQPVWGNTVYTGVTDNYGECKIKRDLPINKYGIVIRHSNYNQFEGYLNLNKNKKEYVMQMDTCYEYCILEGKISCTDCKDSFLFDSREYQSFFVKMFDGHHKIENFNYDALGNYTLKLPAGEYTIIFHYWFWEIAKINITVIKDKNVKSNINFLDSNIYKTEPVY
ncbi:MAG TPA: hypothetical protein PKY56_08965 [Candidatus Kapabacteria bacterium]|nr:hypothetical protein [Candidatus Kapabacteria bacterium]HPO62342.1 hypothetical protein [Candidatus Kapabacteria bacterium]